MKEIRKANTISLIKKSFQLEPAEIRAGRKMGNNKLPIGQDVTINKFYCFDVLYTNKLQKEQSEIKAS